MVIEKVGQHRCIHDGCDLAVDGNGPCFWHDAARDKTGDEVRGALEDVAMSGASLAGFKLAHANLQGINLNRRGSKFGYDLSGADLFHADLRDAHLFQVDLTGASLMKAHLEGANLNHSKLRGANLLGVIFGNTKTENVDWGDQIRQHQAAAARAIGDRAAELSCAAEAEEIYRNLRKQAENAGRFETAGSFFVTEMVMRRYQMPPWSLARFFSKSVDLFCGYGERPFRVVLFSVCLVLGCALLYLFTGVQGQGGMIAFDPNLGVLDNILIFLNILYFSVVTFTALGYGDMSPVGISRFIAASEAFLGAFVLALFVVVFVKKMTR